MRWVAFSRARIRDTWTPVHVQPRAVGIARSFNATAIPRNDVMPAARISEIAGEISAARSLARAAMTAHPAAAALANNFAPRLPPSLAPRALAAASADFVRAEINLAS